MMNTQEMRTDMYLGLISVTLSLFPHERGARYTCRRLTFSYRGHWAAVADPSNDSRS